MMETEEAGMGKGVQLGVARARLLGYGEAEAPKK